MCVHETPEAPRVAISCCRFYRLAGYQPAQGHRSQPQEIYHRAWQLVRDNYYDSTFNGHDWNDLEHKYDSQIKTTEDSFKYIKVMLENLNDPYTRFLDPRAFQDENDAIDARIVGIGINLQQSKENGKLIITRTIEDGPAEQAGLRSGDEIIGIDGLNAIGMTPEQAAEHIRGKQGTAGANRRQACQRPENRFHHASGNHNPCRLVQARK